MSSIDEGFEYSAYNYFRKVKRGAIDRHSRGWCCGIEFSS